MALPGWELLMVGAGGSSGLRARCVSEGDAWVDPSVCSRRTSHPGSGEFKAREKAKLGVRSYVLLKKK